MFVEGVVLVLIYIGANKEDIRKKHIPSPNKLVNLSAR